MFKRSIQKQKGHSIIKIGNIKINQTKQVKNLGVCVIIDEDLTT